MGLHPEIAPEIFPKPTFAAGVSISGTYTILHPEMYPGRGRCCKLILTDTMTCELLRIAKCTGLLIGWRGAQGLSQDSRNLVLTRSVAVADDAICHGAIALLVWIYLSL